MKLTVLVDNNTYIDKYFCGEPGLSFFIEDEDTRILFDTGYSGLFLANAAKLNIDMRNLDYVVISHGHNDHTWGLEPLMRHISEAASLKLPHKIPTLVAHPVAFFRKIYNGHDIGSLISGQRLAQTFSVLSSRTHLWLTNKLVFLGEINRKSAFEGIQPIGQIETEGSLVDDFLLDDTALAYKGEEGLVIITGCSHSGITNIIEHAKAICHDSRIRDVIGGFHLLNTSEERLKNTVDYLKMQSPAALHACHCTDMRAKIALAEKLPISEVGVGLIMEYK